MNDFIPVFVPMIRFRIDKGYLIMFVNVIIQNIFFIICIFHMLFLGVTVFIQTQKVVSEILDGKMH